jgi:CRP/FNR family transcriptional regulator, cyclic AMP receptor protein
MENLERFIAECPFFAGLDHAYLNLIVGCASNVRFDAGTYVFREGAPADTFYLLREGKVTVEIFTPHHKPMVVATIGEGEIVGWSWLLPPYVWKFNGKAMQNIRAIALDGKCLRTKCEENHDLGYEVLKRLVQIIEHRLDEARFQLMDVYAVR